MTRIRRVLLAFTGKVSRLSARTVAHSANARNITLPGSRIDQRQWLFARALAPL